MPESLILLHVVTLEGNSITQCLLYQESGWERVETTSSCSPASRYRSDLRADDSETIRKKLHLLRLLGGQENG
jgi:hypothetical protein